MPIPPPNELSDAQLLELLRTALAPEPPPHHTDMLLTGYDLRHADDLVAAMTHDSAEMAAAGTRGPATGVRELTFGHGEVTIDVEVDGRTLVGQVIGALVPEIILEWPAGSRSAPVDEVGRFRFEEVDGGPARLRIDHAGARVVTGWQVI